MKMKQMTLVMIHMMNSQMVWNVILQLAPYLFLGYRYSNETDYARICDVRDGRVVVS